MSTDIWKRHQVHGSRMTWAGPISTNLYGEKLKHLCQMTQDNLSRIKSSLMRVDHGVEDWHPPSPHYKQDRSRPLSAQVFCPSLYDPEDISWHSSNVLFSSFGSQNSLTTQSTSSFADSDSGSIASRKASSNFCYLCSTMEEHIQHQDKLKLSRRKCGKARIKYVAPTPAVRVKPTKATEQQEMLYRIDVSTGTVAEASTAANVFITLHGNDDSSLRTHLRKGHTAKYFFAMGSTETFYYKGPKLGDLAAITVEHELLTKTETEYSRTAERKKQHHWFLEKICVTNMKTDQSWVFNCNDWMYNNELLLEASLDQIAVRELQITVVTGNKKMAGTDAKIYLTVYGNKGASRKIFLKNDKNKNKFQQGKEDTFYLSDVKDLGVLKKIRIEHDGAGLASGWYLDKVIIEDPNQHQYRYEFYYGGWIAKGEGEGLLHREIRARTKEDKEVKKGQKIKYLVSVTTGDVMFAGTDANVYIQFVGSNGTTEKLQMDDARDNFERGLTEHFHLQGLDVGALTKVIVSHDNTGPGAGWYLENVKVRRYLSKAVKTETLRRMKKLHKERYVMRRKRLADRMNKDDEKMERNLNDSSDSSSDDDDSKARIQSTSDMAFSEEVFDRDGKPMKYPHYEEYLFSCKAWLATDKGDGRTERELKNPVSQTFYKDVEK